MSLLVKYKSNADSRNYKDSVLSTGAGLLTGALSTFLGVGQAHPQIQQAPTESEHSAQQNPPTTSSINVRTLRDQRTDKDDHQLYNGNQVSQDADCNQNSWLIILAKL